MPQDSAKGSPPLDARLVRRLVAAQFPHWADLEITPVEPGGWDNRTFRLGSDKSVRLPSAPRYAAQVDKEHRILPRLSSALPVPVPVPLARGEPGEGFAHPWSVYRWLPGEPALTSPIEDGEGFARDLASFLRALHAIDAADGPTAGQHSFHRGGRLAGYDAETRAAIASLHGIVDTEGARAVWEAAIASEWARPPVWVHGDFAPGNLLVEGGVLCGVIDFGTAAVGDPACDLAIAWTFLDPGAREVFRAALPLDPATWARGRGWALWKALITAAGHVSNRQGAGMAFAVIADVIDDHRGRP